MAILYKVIIFFTFCIYLFKCLYKKYDQCRPEFVILYIVTFTFEDLILPINKYYLGSNIKIYNLYALTTLIIYWACFKINLQLNNIALKIIKICFFFLYLYVIFYSNKVESRIYITILSLIIFLVIIKYHSFLKDNYIDNLDKQELFLFFGLIIFYVSSFPLLMFYNVLISNQDANMAYNLLLKLGNVFLTLGILASILCLKKEA